MTKKQIHTLLVILAVLLAGILLRQQQVQRGVVTEDYTALDLSFESAQAAKIVLSRGGKTELTAVKNSGGWFLPDLWNTKADSEKVESFLNGLAKLRGELRADDPSLLNDFGIADEAALSIQVLDEKGALLADLKAGTKRAGQASVFIRRAGSSAVFYADLDLFRMLGLYETEITTPVEARLWADLQPFSFLPADVTGLEGTRTEAGQPQAVLQLKRQAGENQPWTFGASYTGFVLDPVKVDNFIRAINILHASSVADPAGSYGFDAPAFQLKVQTAEKPVTLTFGQESADAKSRYLRVDGGPSVYEIPKFSFEDLAADDSRFFAAGLSGVDQAAVETIILKKQKEEKRFTAADTAAFDSILQTLRTLEYAGLLSSAEEKTKARSPGLDTLTLELKGAAPVILDFGEKLEAGAGHAEARYAAQLRSNPVLFSVREADYTNLFETFTPAAPAETNASQPAPNKAE